jgi:hypothetical protein
MKHALGLQGTLAAHWVQEPKGRERRRFMESLPAWVWVVLVLNCAPIDAKADFVSSPYLGIAGRNIFGLKPPLPFPPETPTAPLAKVRLVGITTFGGKRALLNVHWPANPPAPANTVGCILKLGQREGPITVLDINEAAGCVKVDNVGTVLMLVLAHPPNAAPLPNLPPTPTQFMSRR